MKYNKDKFVKLAEFKHNNKYDYTSVEFINCSSKVNIICSIHGIFRQSPSSHLMGHGCPKCHHDKMKLERASTIENFCNRANVIHKNKYDYSLVEYINEKTKIKILCPEHGEFITTPAGHLLQRVGCPYCSGYRFTSKTIIEKFKNVHRETYDYSLVEYVDNKKKVCIICKTHGNFKQTPANHLSGGGCPKCAVDFRADKKTFTTKQFIEKAENVHNNKYDYSLVDYHHSQSKIKIICLIHGMFEQNGNQHLNGQGCPKCSIISASKLNKLTQDEYIEMSKLKHNNKYDYSLTKYEHSKNKIKIICPIHGMFEQKAANHLRGMGCSKCSYEEKSKKYTHTTEQYVETAKKIHGNKYDYSKIEYTGHNDLITVICKKHGEFKIVAQRHISGKCGGCIKCNESNGERILRRLFEDNNISYISQKKFDDCIGKKNKLRFDFYLPQKNTLIEFNGLQHYESVECFGGEIAFKRNCELDIIKRDYAKNNNIKLIEIKYDNIKNIKKILINEKII